MIIDLKKFVENERPFWDELEMMLERLSSDPALRMDIQKTNRFNYLYQRASSGLSRVSGCSSEADIRRYLETLVGRAYAEVHETRQGKGMRGLARWLTRTFPQTFRRHFPAFLLSLCVTLVGAAAGGAAISFDDEAKKIIIPFEHLAQTPAERVAEEESKPAGVDDMKGKKTTFSAFLMTHNIRVSIATFAMGLTFGIGTILMLFYNGIILGAVVLDYILAGQTVFLVGWLLPHGSVEIPSILIAGQAGFVLASALIGWGRGVSLRARLRNVTHDVATLLFGLALLLVWAGIIEAFFSQYHEPVLPYHIKIAFGCLELAALSLFLGLSGRRKTGA